MEWWRQREATRCLSNSWTATPSLRPRKRFLMLCTRTPLSLVDLICSTSISVRWRGEKVAKLRLFCAELRRAHAGIPLRDHDATNVKDGDWVKINTLGHYRLAEMVSCLSLSLSLHLSHLFSFFILFSYFFISCSISSSSSSSFPISSRNSQTSSFFVYHFPPVTGSG